MVSPSSTATLRTSPFATGSESSATLRPAEGRPQAEHLGNHPGHGCPRHCWPPPQLYVCLDADTTAQEPLTHIIGALVAMEPTSPRSPSCPSEEEAFIVQMQRHEYVVSMRARRIMPWLLSGALHRQDRRHAPDHGPRHSLLFQGNDFESGYRRHWIRAVHILARQHQRARHPVLLVAPANRLGGGSLQAFHHQLR